MTETHRYLAIDRKTGDPLWVANLTEENAAQANANPYLPQAWVRAVAESMSDVYELA